MVKYLNNESDWFAFKLLALSDLPGQGHEVQLDANLPRRLRMDGNMRDVFAMVKGYMSDTSLIQPPLLVYPEAFVPSSEEYFGQVNSTRHVITQSLESERIADLEALAQTFSKDFPSLDRCARYYASLVDMDRARKPFPRLAFVDAGPGSRNHLAGVQIPVQPAEPRNHWLQVVFHHYNRGQ